MGARQTYREYLAEHGGMATMGEGLGVRVGADPSGTPAGWMFIPLGTSTEVFADAWEQAKADRKAWPPTDQ